MRPNLFLLIRLIQHAVQLSHMFYSVKNWVAIEQLCAWVCVVQHISPSHYCILQVLMHNAFCLTKAKVFLPPWLTLLLPQQKFARKLPVSKRTKTISSYVSFSSRNEWRKMHTSRSSRSTTYSYSRCVMCVYVSVCGACVCIVYMSAYEKCWPDPYPVSITGKITWCLPDNSSPCLCSFPLSTSPLQK